MKHLGILIASLLFVFLAFTYVSVSTAQGKNNMCELVNFEDADKVNFKRHDSVLVAASTLYDGHDLKEFMQGEHYRDAWSTPIKVPILFLDSLKGGMTILEEGGGNQTTSLDIADSLGVVYSLRSVNKNPEKFIPGFLKFMGLENLVRDGISAQHPYGAIIAAALSDHVDLLHTHPKIVFLPRQESLDSLNDEYGNKLYLLEYETEGEENWTTYSNVEELIDTDNLIEFIIESDKKVILDDKTFVRARLFDILIGDWDRHAKQWGWVLQEFEDRYFVTPIAGDRDNAFYNVDGLIPEIVSNEHITPQLRPFKKDIDFLPGLVQSLDAYFLFHTPESVFIEQAEFIQDKLSDEIILASLGAWPQPIHEIDASAIFEKLKARRNDLKQYATRFKEIIIENGFSDKPILDDDDISDEILIDNCIHTIE